MACLYTFAADSKSIMSSCEKRVVYSIAATQQLLWNECNEWHAGGGRLE